MVFILLTISVHLGEGCRTKGNGQVLEKVISIDKSEISHLSRACHEQCLLNTAVGKVFNNYFSGTDGSVYLEFRSKKFKFKEKNEAFNCEQDFFFAKTFDFHFQRMILPLYV